MQGIYRVLIGRLHIHAYRIEGQWIFSFGFRRYTLRAADSEDSLQILFDYRVLFLTAVLPYILAVLVQLVRLSPAVCGAGSITDLPR